MSNFAWWFIDNLGRESPIFVNFAPPEAQNHKSATHPELKFRVGRATVIVCTVRETAQHVDLGIRPFPKTEVLVYSY